MADTVRRKGKHHKYGGRNVGPARNHYWNARILRKHKVRNLMRCNGMTRVQAEKYWDKARTKRIRLKTIGAAI